MKEVSNQPFKAIVPITATHNNGIVCGQLGEDTLQDVTPSTRCHVSGISTQPLRATVPISVSQYQGAALHREEKIHCEICECLNQMPYQ